MTILGEQQWKSTGEKYQGLEDRVRETTVRLCGRKRPGGSRIWQQTPRNLSREQGGRLRNWNNILRDLWHSSEQCPEARASAMRTKHLIQKERQVKRPLSWKVQGNVGLCQPHRSKCRLVCPRVGEDLTLERDGRKAESGWMRIPSTGNLGLAYLVKLLQMHRCILCHPALRTTISNPPGILLWFFFLVFFVLCFVEIIISSIILYLMYPARFVVQV